MRLLICGHGDVSENEYALLLLYHSLMLLVQSTWLVSVLSRMRSRCHHPLAGTSQNRWSSAGCSLPQGSCEQQDLCKINSNTLALQQQHKRANDCDWSIPSSIEKNNRLNVTASMWLAFIVPPNNFATYKIHSEDLKKDNSCLWTAMYGFYFLLFSMFMSFIYKPFLWKLSDFR